MVKQILTTLKVATKPGRRKGVVYRSPRIYLPTKLTDDSTFPFIGGESLVVAIVGKTLVVKRARGGGRHERSRRRRKRAA